MPANTKPSGSPAGGRTIAGPTSSVPIGGKKAVGGAKKAVGGVTGGAARGLGGVNGVVGGATRTAGSTVGGVGRAANSTLGGVSNGAYRGGDGLAGLTGGASKSVGGLAGSATKSTGGLVNGATRGVGGIAGGLPKPYNPASSGSSYSSPYPTAKKTAVKPGQSKPFSPNPQQGKPEPKPYPGTNTLPGQGGKKTPVKRTYKPAPTLGSQVQPGQKMTHIGAF